MSGVGAMCGWSGNLASTSASRSGSASVTSTMYTAVRIGLRASKLRLKTSTRAISAASRPNSRRAAACSVASGCSASASVSLISESLIMSSYGLC